MAVYLAIAFAPRGELLRACCVFRGARDDAREYIKMKTMPANVGQWRVAPRAGILEALHAFYLGGGSHRFRAFNALTANGAIYARGIRFRVSGTARHFFPGTRCCRDGEGEPSTLKRIREFKVMHCEAN